MVKRKRKGKLFWIVLVIALILLAVLYGFVIKKRVVDSREDDLASGEDGSDNDNGVGGDIVDSSGVTNGVGSSGSSSGGGSGSGGSSDSSGDDGDVIMPPPVVPEVDIE